MKVTKAIIPAAGYGTRMLPATNAIPKEMLTVVDKPVIQYVVEEAVAAGLTDILIIISKGKEAIINHFNTSIERIADLRAKGKGKIADEVIKINNLANIQFVYQEVMSGLGDAILHGKAFAKNEPVAVLLGDSIYTSDLDTAVLAQMVEKFDRHQTSLIAIAECQPDQINRYGIMIGKKIDDENVFQSDSWIEKPEIGSVDSTMAIAGLYILTPKIFELLEHGQSGHGGEIQVTDSIQKLLTYEKVLAYKIRGTRYDIGQKINLIEANVVLGLSHPELGEQVQELLNKYLKISTHH